MPVPAETSAEKISIATSTFYPRYVAGETDLGNLDQVRGNLALELIRSAQERRYSINVVDDGSSPEWIEAAQALGIKVYPQVEKGMSSGRRQALVLASQMPGAEAVVWTEPEKVSFVEDCLETACLSILAANMDLVVPRRNRYLFRTSYPNYQVRVEDFANDGFNHILFNEYGQTEYLDTWFGPKVFANDQKVLDLALRQFRYTPPAGLTEAGLARAKGLNPELWAGICALPVVAALHEDLSVISVDVPFRYPEIQKKAEETAAMGPGMEEKRMNQLRNVIVLSLEYARLLKGDPRSRLTQVV